MAEILVLCSRTPYPPVGGAKLRLFHTTRLLADSHTVDLLIVDEQPVDDHRVDALSEMVRDVKLFTFPSHRFRVNALTGIPSQLPLQTHYFHFRRVQRWVHGNLGAYDLAYANHVRTTEYIRENEGIPTVVDLVDAVSRNYARTERGVSLLRRPLYHLERRRLSRYEQDVVRGFDQSLITTAADRNHVVEGLSEPIADRLTVLPNGVDERLLEWSPSPKPGRIVFLGKMDYFPNEDAAVHFATDVFPSIRAVESDAEFVIVGASPSEKVSRLQECEGVRVTGFVDDPAEYLASASVVVAPLRYGAGLQNKILEAMALARPVVTTSVGVEGIDCDDEVIVAEDDESFAAAVVDLLGNPERGRRTGQAARELVRETYRWDIVEPTLLSVVEESLRSS